MGRAAKGQANASESRTLERFVYRELSVQAEVLASRAAAARVAINAEAVHRLRVATRRAESALRNFRAVLPGSLYTDFYAELRWLAAALGEVRDLDVYHERYIAFRATLPVEDAKALRRHETSLDAERQVVERGLAETLDGERCRKLLQDFASTLAEGREAAEEPFVLDEEVFAYIARARKKVMKRAKRIRKDSAPERLHSLRIRIKRFRYLLEFFLPLDESRFERAVRAAVRVQDVLGLHQDSCTAIARLRRYAATVPADGEFRRELVALGQFVAAERVASEKARKAFAKEWREFKRSAAAFTLED